MSDIPKMTETFKGKVAPELKKLSPQMLAGLKKAIEDFWAEQDPSSRDEEFLSPEELLSGRYREGGRLEITVEPFDPEKLGRHTERAPDAGTVAVMLGGGNEGPSYAVWPDGHTEPLG